MEAMVSAMAVLSDVMAEIGGIGGVGEFSRTYCLQICLFLVPANVLTTVAMLAMRLQGRSLADRWPVAAVALLFATVMVVHVGTWFVVGVVMAPTYILLTLGLVCSWINGRALLEGWRGQAAIAPTQ